MKYSVKNMEALTKDLSVAYSQLRSGQLDKAEAKEIANMAGKLIKSTIAQLEYNQYMKKQDKIEFFEPPVAEEK